MPIYKMWTLTEFIADNAIRMDVRTVPFRPDVMTDMQRHFRCRLTNDSGKSFSLYFSQGSAYTRPPTTDEVLDCLASDASGYDNSNNFEDWASEYGYDSDSRASEKIFKCVKRRSEQLKRFLGASAFEVLLYETERL